MGRRPVRLVDVVELWRAIADAEATVDGYHPSGDGAWTTTAVARRLLSPAVAVGLADLAGRLSRMATLGLLSSRDPAGRGAEVGLWRWRMTQDGRRFASQRLGGRPPAVPR